MKNKTQNLSIKDLARLYGTSVSDLPKICKTMTARGKFRYRLATPDEHKNITLGVLKRIDSPDHTLAGPKGKPKWQKGWEENLQDFITSNYDVKTLLPKYIKSFRPIRLDGSYAIPLDGNFELNYQTAFFEWIFSKYLKNVNSIYEFGCGTGFNLILLAQMFPEKQLYGLDWVASSKKILELLAKKIGFKMKGRVFDMLKPDRSLKLKPNSAVINIASLEQIGRGFKPFVDFILKNSPAIVLDVNHINELYDPNVLLDYLALKFEHRRGYLDGYLTHLRELEKRGKIKILKVQRSQLGSLYHDGFSHVIWKPIQ